MMMPIWSSSIYIIPWLFQGWKGANKKSSVHLASQTYGNTACTTAQHIYLIRILYSNLLANKWYILHTISELKNNRKITLG